MVLSIKLLKNAVKLLLVSVLLQGVCYAGPAILATSYTVVDLKTGEVLKEHNTSEVRSIASITKLMTAVVVLDAKQDLSEEITVESAPGVSTKLKAGIKVTRKFLMHVALMSSDNLAAKLLATNFPGGEHAFVEQMNHKAALLGMVDTKYVEPTGLSVFNVSTARDLVKLLSNAQSYKEIRDFSTDEHTELSISSKKKPKIVYFNTTNSLVKKYKDIVVSKTGWIKSSGGCLIMLVRDQISERAIVVLNSRNTRTRITDGDLLYGIYNNGKNI